MIRNCAWKILTIVSMLAVAAGVSAPARTLLVEDTSIQRGEAGYVSIVLDAEGDENALSFSIAFDAELLQYVSHERGPDVPASSLLFANPNFAAEGKFGGLLGLQPLETFPAGRLELLRIHFQTTPGEAMMTPVVFMPDPVPLSFSAASADPLPFETQAGSITLLASEPPDPTPEPTPDPTPIATATPTPGPTATPTPTSLPVVYTTDVTGDPYAPDSVFSIDVAVGENTIEPVRAYAFRITFDGDSLLFLDAEAIAGELDAEPEVGPVEGAGLDTYVNVATLGALANERMDLKLFRLHFQVRDTVAASYSIAVADDPNNFALIGMSYAEIPCVYDNTQTSPMPRAPEPTDTPEPTATPEPTPTPTEYPDPSVYYDIAYFHRGRNTPALIEVTTGGIRVLTGATPNDALRITARARQAERPPIRLIRSDTGLRRIYTEAPVDYVMIDGPLVNLTTRDAHVAAIGADQIGVVRMMAHNEQDVATRIHARQPFYVNRREVKGRIMLTGVMLRQLEAPEASFQALVTDSKIFIDPRTRARALSLGGVYAPMTHGTVMAPMDEDLTDLEPPIIPGVWAKHIDVIRAHGAAIHADWIQTETRAVVTQGQEFALGNGVLVEVPGDIAVENFFLMGPTVQIALRGGSILGGAILASGRITDVVARDLRKRDGLPMGGHVGAFDLWSPSSTFELVVASGLDSDVLGVTPNIDRIIGHQGINAIFHAGADFDPDTWTVAPDFEGLVRQVGARREKIVRGVITMRPDAPARFPQFIGPIYNDMIIETE